MTNGEILQPIHIDIEPSEFISLSQLLAGALVSTELTAAAEEEKTRLYREIDRPIHVFPAITRLRKEQIDLFASVVNLDMPAMTFYIVDKPAILTDKDSSKPTELNVNPGDLIMTADNTYNLEAVKTFLFDNS